MFRQMMIQIHDNILSSWKKFFLFQFHLFDGDDDDDDKGLESKDCQVIIILDDDFFYSSLKIIIMMNIWNHLNQWILIQFQREMIFLLFKFYSLSNWWGWRWGWWGWYEGTDVVVGVERKCEKVRWGRERRWWKMIRWSLSSSIDYYHEICLICVKKKFFFSCSINK